MAYFAFLQNPFPLILLVSFFLHSVRFVQPRSISLGKEPMDTFTPEDIGTDSEQLQPLLDADHELIPDKRTSSSSYQPTLPSSSSPSIFTSLLPPIDIETEHGVKTVFNFFNFFLGGQLERLKFKVGTLGKISVNRIDDQGLQYINKLLVKDTSQPFNAQPFYLESLNSEPTIIPLFFFEDSFFFTLQLKHIPTERSSQLQSQGWKQDDYLVAIVSTINPILVYIVGALKKTNPTEQMNSWIQAHLEQKGFQNRPTQDLLEYVSIMISMFKTLSKDHP